MRRVNWLSYLITSIAFFTVFLVVVVTPLVLVYAQSFWAEGRITLTSYRDVLLSSRQWALLFRSAGLALAVACCATVLGAGAAFAADRLTPKLRMVFLLALTMPIVVPQHIMAIAWIDVLGRSGYLSRFVQLAMPGAPPTPGPFNLIGALFILSMTYFPIPMLATVAAMNRFDNRFLEAATLAGQSKRAFGSVVMPLALPMILTGSLAVFTLAISTFSVPSLLQVNTYPVEIHTSASSFDYGAAAAQSLPLIAVCMLAYSAWARYVRPRHAWLSGALRTVKRTERAHSVFAAMIVIAVAGLTLVVPFTALFVRSLPLHTYASVWNTAHEEILTGLTVAIFAATFLSFLSCVIAYFSRRSFARPLVRYGSLFAFVVSGPLFALGMIAVWNRPGLPGAVYDSAAILVLACVARFFVLGDAAFAAQRARMNSRLIEAASVAGVVWWRRFTGIIWPLALPTALGVWVLTFVLALGEVDVSVLLCPPGTSTFAVRLFSLMHYGPDSFVAALSFITALGVVILAVVGVIGFRVLSRRIDARA